MADILQLNTTLLAVKINGTASLPQRLRTNSAAVKTVMEFLKYADLTILYAGDDELQPDFDEVISEDTAIAKIHVIEAPLIINFARPNAEIIKWFLKQLRSSKKHIVIKNTVQNGRFLQTSLDIYVRGIFIPTSQTKVRRLHQPTNQLNYAV